MNQIRPSNVTEQLLINWALRHWTLNPQMHDSIHWIHLFSPWLWPYFSSFCWLSSLVVLVDSCSVYQSHNFASPFLYQSLGTMRQTSSRLSYEFQRLLAHESFLWFALGCEIQFYWSLSMSPLEQSHFCPALLVRPHHLNWAATQCPYYTESVIVMLNFQPHWSESGLNPSFLLRRGSSLDPSHRLSYAHTQKWGRYPSFYGVYHPQGQARSSDSEEEPTPCWSSEGRGWLSETDWLRNAWVQGYDSESDAPYLISGEAREAV